MAFSKEEKLRQLQQDLDQCTKEYQATSEAARTSIDPKNEIRLKKQAEALHSAMCDIEAEIKQLEQESFSQDQLAATANASTGKQVNIFCSISSDSSDRKHLQSFKEYLSYLQSSSNIHYWDRTESFGGQIRTQYIKEKICKSSILVIFVSAAYFSSSDSKYEFQEIAKFYAQKKPIQATIIPVICRPTPTWKNMTLIQEQKLGDFVSFPENKSLSELTKPSRDKIFNDIIDHIQILTLSDQKY